MLRCCGRLTSANCTLCLPIVPGTVCRVELLLDCSVLDCLLVCFHVDMHFVAPLPNYIKGTAGNK